MESCAVWIFAQLYNKCNVGQRRVGMRKRRVGMAKMPEKLQTGECTFRWSGNLVALKWQDKREVCCPLAIQYKHCKKKNYQTGEQIQKPLCVVDYSNSMGTVDKSDAIIRTISLVRFVTDRRRIEVVNKRTEFPFKRAAWLWCLTSLFVGFFHHYLNTFFETYIENWF